MLLLWVRELDDTPAQTQKMTSNSCGTIRYLGEVCHSRLKQEMEMLLRSYTRKGAREGVDKKVHVIQEADNPEEELLLNVC